jgi:hypothetical protein
MPRIAREVPPGAVVHIISRFVNGQYLMADDDCRAEYLRRLSRALTRTDWELLSFGLMSSHTHLAARAGRDALDRLMRSLNTGFALWLNAGARKRGCTARGPVFAERPTTVVVEHERAAYLFAYIHNNPVRAGLVSSAADSSWTSHRAMIGLTPPPPALNVALCLHLSGLDGGPDDRARFHELVHSRSADPRDPELSGRTAAAARCDLRKLEGTAVELETGRLVGPRTEYLPSRPIHARVRVAFGGPPVDVIAATSRVTGVPMEDMTSRDRSRLVTRARRVALHAWRRLERPAVELAAALGISRPSASELIVSGESDPSLAAAVDDVVTWVSGPLAKPNFRTPSPGAPGGAGGGGENLTSEHRPR